MTDLQRLCVTRVVSPRPSMYSVVKMHACLHSERGSDGIVKFEAEISVYKEACVCRTETGLNTSGNEIYNKTH